MLILLVACLVNCLNACFTTHFVLYGNVTDNTFHRLMNFNYPYIMHLNEEIKFPGNYALKRSLTPVQKSDIKKMEVIYHHGGLYIDNDQLIDMECIKNILCPLKPGLYVMDWSDRLADVWIKSIPISFIYANQPQIKTIQKILTSYNQSQKQAVDFSGPFHAQKYREEFNFVQVNRSCQYHYGMMTWSTGKSLQTVAFTKKWDQINKLQNLSKVQQQFKQKQKQIFTQIWQTHSVIYSNKYDYGEVQKMAKQYNHIQIIDKNKLQFKVIKYSQIIQIKQKLTNFMQKFNKTVKIRISSQDIMAIWKQSQWSFDVYEQGEYLSNKQPNILIEHYWQILKVWILFTVILSIVLFFKQLVLFISSIKLPFKKQYKQLIPQQSQAGITIEQKSLNESQDSYTNVSYSENAIHKQQLVYKLAVILCSSMLIGVGYVYLSNKQSSISYGQKYGIEYGHVQKQINNITLQKYGLRQYYQVMSQFDYLNVSNLPKFIKFKQQYLQNIQHKTHMLPQSSKQKEKQKTLLKYSSFKDKTQMDKQLHNHMKWTNKEKLPNNAQTYLSSYLAYNVEIEKSKQLEYYFYDKIYHLSSITKETPFCLITVVQQKQDNIYVPLMNSIKQQNYSNYQVVIVDDSANTTQQIYSYLQGIQNPIKNRVKIVENKGFKIGQAASTYRWESQCEQNSIVVAIDISAKLIGYQTLNILNAIYTSNPSLSYTYVNYLQQTNSTSKPIIGQYAILQKQLNSLSTDQFRNKLQLGPVQMIAFRKQLMGAVPIEHLMEYYDPNYNETYKKDKILLPKFYYDSGLKILSYSLLQLCGKDRSAVIKHSLYLLNQYRYPSCTDKRQAYTQMRARLKYPLHLLQNNAKLNTENQQIKKSKKFVKKQNIFNFKRQYDQTLIDKLEKAYSFYQRCLYVFDPPSNLQ